METEVVVTKKGQTTIPVRLRKKFKIEEGTRLEVIVEEKLCNYQSPCVF